jgi:hypothetical protein
MVPPLTTFPRFAWAKATLAKYDAHGIFTDALLAKLFA